MDPEEMKKGLSSIWALTALFSSIFFFSSEYFWVVGIALLVLLLRTLYLIYINESYVAFLSHFQKWSLASFTLMISGGFYMVGRSDYEQSFVDSISLAMVPVLLFAVEVGFFYFTRSPNRRAGYEVRDNRVLVAGGQYSQFAGNILASIVAVSALAMKMAWHVSDGVVGIYVLTLSVFYLIYVSRNSIRMLKAIKAKEKRASELTFENIDQIREARRRWWTSRLLNWLISLSKPSGR
ncbi:MULTISPECIES: hypothetical protein [Pseudomonas]|uniref:hypothetical protein n=1 Tax=Pseudomonas TaxID=286 RepID=UPI000C08CA99|nr:MULTISPECIES: hypothetical protein [Pseudomonas]MCD5978425.1 hypothetical protein [Pseudomonas quasicaspiana]PHN17119.1 hypothetical protein AO242_20665 [Pseudomonas sp. ICMP 561]